MIPWYEKEACEEELKWLKAWAEHPEPETEYVELVGNPEPDYTYHPLSNFVHGVGRWIFDSAGDDTIRERIGFAFLDFAYWINRAFLQKN